jgi:hypothetical protein
MTRRFMNAPGSPSSALQMMHDISGCCGRTAIFWRTEAGAPAQTRGQDGVDYILGCHVGEHYPRPGSRLRQYIRILLDQFSAVAQNDAYFFGLAAEFFICDGDLMSAEFATTRFLENAFNQKGNIR